jgi:hypothetical protein
MQLYRFATSGYDSDEEIWLGRDEPIKDFKQAVVDSILKCHEGWSERNLAKVFTIWGSLLPDVCDILCRDHGFMYIEPTCTVIADTYTGYEDMCKEIDKYVLPIE